MKHKPLIVFPVEAPVHYNPFDLYAALEESLAASGESLQDGDVLAVSSKYTAISEGRVVALSAISVTPEAQAIAARYGMNAHMVQLVLQEADHVFGGITGFLLTYKDGIVSPNAGIDRSNIPNGYAVLFPKEPYRSAEALRLEVRRRFNVEIGVILTDSWLMPGRRGTAGVALATAGFKPLQDERGKDDLFGGAVGDGRARRGPPICNRAQRRRRTDRRAVERSRCGDPVGAVHLCAVADQRPARKGAVNRRTDRLSCARPLPSGRSYPTARGFRRASA